MQSLIHSFQPSFLWKEATSAQQEGHKKPKRDHRTGLTIGNPPFLLSLLYRNCRHCVDCFAVASDSGCLALPFCRPTKLEAMEVESEDQKKLRVVQAEVGRMRLLPSSSAYAIHRLRVLNKMTQILSVAPEKRNKVQLDELEQLFAGLSF